MGTKKDKSFQLLTITQLAITYGTSNALVRSKIGDTPIYEVVNGRDCWHLDDVSTLIDKREKTAPIISAKTKQLLALSNVEPQDNPDNDPTLMTAVEKINHYKAEDLKESAMIKKRKNDVECARLMVATQVERTVAEAFKKIALTLDTLPDLLERDGIIANNDIQKVIALLDNSREQLAIDLSGISLSIEEINDKGEW